MPLLNILNEDNYFSFVDAISLTLGMSKSDVRRLITGGGVTLWYSNEEPDFASHKYKLHEPFILRDPKRYHLCTEDDYWVVKVGKRKYLSVSQAIGELLTVVM